MSFCRYNISKPCENHGTSSRTCLDCVLDQIRAEIEALPKTYPFVNHINTYIKEDDVKKILDKYKEEREG